MERVTHLDHWNNLVKGRDGWFLVNANDMYIGRSLIKYGEFSAGEMKLFRQVVKPGDIVAEIGANIGSHTVGLAQQVQRQGRILAFEPQPVVFQNLCANVALNGLTNVDTFHCGLGAAPDTTVVPDIRYEQEGNFGGFSLSTRYRQGTPVEVKRFDDVFRYPRLNLIKIDVEGMEEAVLRGARGSIERFKPVLYVENDRVEQSEALIRLIMEMGYRLWWHLPPLFSDDNFFGDRENIFGNIASLNVVCFHQSVPVVLNGFQEIVDPGKHPLARDRDGGG
ncbi:FkbM family methyltransferase [Stieleria sp.]|uniref:FkbM family methyltransferase n=1 Tax=Stieleria sp. TaxID=2795976 RepID=UPI00356B3BC6